jgi:hypothetical protein
MYFLCFLSYLCFSTASSRKAKEAASVNLQPLQSNLKVLQEQQTQCQTSTDLPLRLMKSFPVFREQGLRRSLFELIPPLE